MLMRPRHYLVEFEAPDSDGEYIATCLGIGELMTALADRIDDWAEDLVAKGMPRPIVAQFEQAVADLDEAAQQARRSAANFADYYDDARTLAARGIRIIGAPRRRAA
jgi:hypothetical protein